MLKFIGPFCYVFKILVESLCIADENIFSEIVSYGRERAVERRIIGGGPLAASFESTRMIANVGRQKGRQGPLEIYLAHNPLNGAGRGALYKRRHGSFLGFSIAAGGISSGQYNISIPRGKHMLV